MFTPPVALAEFRFPEIFKAIGTATFTELPEGLKVMVEVTGFKSGRFSIYIIGSGECEPFVLGRRDEVDPALLEQGWDIGVLEVAGSGHGRFETVVPGLSVARGPRPVAGRTVVLIEGAGEPFGKRLACGVVERLPEPQPLDPEEG